MKKSMNLKLLSAVFLMVTSLFLFQSCEKKIKELTEGAQLEINSDLLHTPLVAQFVDANEGDTPAGLTVELIGQDASSLYSSSGKLTLRPVEGIMDIAFEKSINPTTENPLEFTIVARADGYLPAFQTILLTDVEPRAVSIEMVKLDNAPEGVRITNETFAVGAEGLTETKAFETSTASGDLSTLYLDEGTKFFDVDGNELTGQATLEIVYFDQNVQAMQNLAPQSPLVDRNGNRTTGVFANLSDLSIEIRIGNASVKTFSSPLRLFSFIPENSIAEDGQPIGDGYVIPAWSFDESTGIWVEESQNTVSSTANGVYFVQTEIPHLSFWRQAAFWETLFSSSNTITINSDVPNSDELDYLYYSELEFTFFNRIIRNYWWSMTKQPFRNGDVISQPYFAMGFLPYQIKVYSGNWSCKGEQIAESNFFTWNDNANVNLNSLFAIQPQLNFQFAANAICPGVTVKPTMYVLYRESASACDSYNLLGVMVNGIFQTSALATDVEYDFKTVWNDNAYDLNNITVRTLVEEYGSLNNLTSEQITAILNNTNEAWAESALQIFEIQPTTAECDALTGG